MFCSICLENCNSYNVRMVGCIHHHCLNCFIDWSKQKQSCPMCRNENDTVSIFNGHGRHISDSSVLNLRKMPERGCTICFKESASFTIKLTGCDHPHCANCFIDWGKNECPTCGNPSSKVSIFNSDGRFLYQTMVHNLVKAGEETWLGSDEEEIF